MTATMSQVNLNTNTMTNAYNNGVGGGGGDGAGDVTNNVSAAASNTTAAAAAAAAAQTQQQLQISNGNSSINNHQHAFNDHVKRKKLKSRSATMPVGDGYIKDHLDAWLENCLKDAANTQLSSSSEFLDFNPNATNITNKNAYPMHAQLQQQNQHAQQQQQQQQHQQLPQQRQQREHHHQQQHQQLNYLPQQRAEKQPQQHFASAAAGATNANATTNTTNGYSTPFNQSFLRNMPNYMRPSGASASAASAFNNRYSLNFPLSGCAYFPQTDASQDFASLPPIVNLLGGVGSGEHDNNSTDVLDGSASNPNISRGFRFSDPCLLNPSDNDSKTSEPQTTSRNNLTQADIDNSLQQNNNNNNNNKFFAALMEQINLLHETNSKIFRNLHETKVDIEALKHTPHWGGMRHRRDSLSGLSTHSQPMIFGGGLSTHSPASTYQSGAYAPGMMTDVVREVKEAARVREDALLNRVKALVEERQWSLNESNLRIMRDIEELKTQVHHLRLERKEANKRINHLETENKYMRQMLATLLNNQRHAQQDVLLENDTLRMRKPYPNARRSQSMNLHYGIMHEQQHAHLHHPHQQQQAQVLNTSSLSVEEETDEALQLIETPSTTSTADIAQLPIKSGQRALKTATQTPDKRHSMSSTDSSGGATSTGSAGGSESNGQSVINGSGKKQTGQIPSPPTFALITTPISDDVPKDKVLAMTDKKLKEAVAAREEADKRIIALEKLVTNLRVQTNQAMNVIGDGAANNAATSSKTMSSPAIAAPKRNKQKSTMTTQVSSATNIRRSTTAKAQQHASNLSNGFDKTYSPTHRLSVAGPITDL